MAGLWFEEFAVGMTFAHPWTRTITETDNRWFSLLTMNPQPLHIDAHAAAQTEFGRPVVNSLFTLGCLVGMTVNDTTLNTTVANLGMTDVTFPHPLFEGDTIVAVGRNLDATADEVIDAGRMIVMPGLVNAHMHTWEAALRGIGAEWMTPDYMAAIRFRRELQEQLDRMLEQK